MNNTATNNLLVIDNNPDQLALFRGWVSNTSFVVIEANTGAKALDAITRDDDGLAGICMGHHFRFRKRLEDQSLPQPDLVNLIISHIPKVVPILVYTRDRMQGDLASTCFRDAGFATTRILNTDLNETHFQTWLEGDHFKPNPPELTPYQLERLKKFARKFQAAAPKAAKVPKAPKTKVSKAAVADAPEKTSKPGGNPAKLLAYLQGTLNANEFSQISQTAVGKATGIALGSMTAAIKKLTENGRIIAGPTGSYKLADSGPTVAVQ